MARARLIKPGFFANEVLAECTPMARLLFAGLWTIADRAGRLEDRPKRIKGELFPYETIDPDALLNELALRGFIVRYAADETAYIQVVSFEKHQSPHVREPASSIPAPDEHVPSTVLAPALSGSSTAGDPVHVSGKVPSQVGTGTVRHKPIDDSFLEDLQRENPTVNVRDIYARCQNRKTWDGYKDKRRALRDHVGYALADKPAQRPEVIEFVKPRGVALPDMGFKE